MDFLSKIEDLINQLILKLGELFLKLIPKPLKRLGEKVKLGFIFLITNFKQLPSLAKNFVLKFIGTIKSTIAEIDLKAIFVDSYQKAMAQHKEQSSANSGKFKTLILTPFLVVAQWVQGLNPAQTLLLLTFSGLSVLSVIGIGFSGKRMVDSHMNANRMPASAEEIEYERPGYYKKQLRHFELVGFRLPVYVAQVNEIRSIDIDFIATISNRNAKIFLEKQEFQLRDYLIVQVEPSVASFPLEEEGKDIIRKKIWMEINDFLKARGIEGEVVELKITYVLAN